MLKFTFTVTEDEGNLILAALIEQPYKYVSGVIDKLNQQARDQRTAVLAASEAEK